MNRNCAIGLALLCAFARPAAAQGLNVLHPDGPYTQAATGMTYPVSVGDFQCVDIYRDFEAKLPPALAALADNPNDPTSLATLGAWYAFRGDWLTGKKYLEQAQSGGAAISHMMLARCDWMSGDVPSATAEFKAAIDHAEAPAEYVNLCIAACAPSHAGKLHAGK